MIYPVSFFKDKDNKALMERVETEGLMDIENEDLTPEGLIAKMYEWDESEHGVDSYNYELAEKELAKAGMTMPRDIRKIPPMWTKVPAEGVSKESAAPFGSVEWQNQKIEEIKEKLDRGEELDQMDIDFMETQHQHNLRHKLYKLNSVPKKTNCRVKG